MNKLKRRLFFLHQMKINFLFFFFLFFWLYKLKLKGRNYLVSHLKFSGLKKRKRLKIEKKWLPCFHWLWLCPLFQRWEQLTIMSCHWPPLVIVCWASVPTTVNQKVSLHFCSHTHTHTFILFFSFIYFYFYFFFRMSESVLLYHSEIKLRFVILITAFQQDIHLTNNLWDIFFLL